jgi:hypothetical protein
VIVQVMAAKQLLVTPLMQVPELLKAQINFMEPDERLRNAAKYSTMMKQAAVVRLPL